MDKLRADMNRPDSSGRNSLQYFRNLMCLAGMLLVVSCATKRDFSELRRETNVNAQILESRLSAIEHSMSLIDSLIKEQMGLSQSMRALLGTQIREQNENIATITSRQDEINYLLKDLLIKLETIQLYGGLETKSTESKPPASAANSATSTNRPAYTRPVTNINPEPDKLYESAMSDIDNNNFALAESRFLSFILQFPKHTLASNAQYWLAESIYAQGKFDLAIKEFEKVRKKYPKSQKSRAALLKIGFSQIEKGDIKNGRSTLQRVIKNYKNSDEAKLAREKVQDLDSQ